MQKKALLILLLALLAVAAAYYSYDEENSYLFDEEDEEDFEDDVSTLLFDPQPPQAYAVQVTGTPFIGSAECAAKAPWYDAAQVFSCSKGSTFNPSTSKCEAGKKITNPTKKCYFCPSGSTGRVAADGSANCVFGDVNSLSGAQECTNSNAVLNTEKAECTEFSGSTTTPTCTSGTYSQSDKQCIVEGDCPYRVPYPYAREYCLSWDPTCSYYPAPTKTATECTGLFIPTCPEGSSLTNIVEDNAVVVRCYGVENHLCPVRLTIESGYVNCILTAEYSCDSGYDVKINYSRGTAWCQNSKNEWDQRRIKCPTDYYEDSKTLKCRRRLPDNICRQGTSYDRSLNKCVTQVSPNCPAGSGYIPSIGICQGSSPFICPQGSTLSPKTKKCETVTPQCPVGQVVNGAGVCQTPSGVISPAIRLCNTQFRSTFDGTNCVSSVVRLS